MATKLRSLSDHDYIGQMNTTKLSVVLVVSDYNADITHSMRDACIEKLIEKGLSKENIIVERTPGAFEIPQVAHWSSFAYSPDAVICIGCVIKGETTHDVHINQAVSNAIMELNMEGERPFIFGLLTPNNHQQALDRAGGKHGNKGVELAMAALKMIETADRLQDEFGIFE